VFQGSPRYPPNLQAIEVLVREVAPVVWAELPDVVFRFVGAGNESLSGTIVGEDERLQFVGYASDLGEELRRAWLSLAPMADGAGIKNKVLDALASGLPVLGFAEAFSGLESPGGTVAVNTPAEMAQRATAMIRDDEWRKRLGMDARSFAESVSWPRQVALYVDAWRGVVGARRHGPAF
jgi:glycosyltransferase involved in cell wall biosynthesis